MIEVIRGSGPVVLGLPHTGTDVPPEVWARLNARGRGLDDTDWHIDRLYRGVGRDVTVVRTPVHRYVIDANRDPSGQSLYPGQNTTGLVPLTDFDGNAIWEPGQEPDAAEIERRRVAYHAPYHAALATEIARLRDIHRQVILYDCHSIRSVIPYLFDGTLPDFNIGTNMSTSCAMPVENLVAGICSGAEGYSNVVNGRFKGGWTTRHYGHPEAGIHAIQMELAQSTYMTEAAPWEWQNAKVTRLKPVLSRIINGLEDLVESRALG